MLPFFSAMKPMNMRLHDAKTERDRSFGYLSSFAQLSNSHHIYFSKLCMMMFGSSWRRSVQSAMELVLAASHPSKIIKTAIFGIPVKMRALKVFWAWPTKRRQKQAMDILNRLFVFGMKSDPGITIGHVITKYFPLTRLKALNTTKIGYSIIAPFRYFLPDFTHRNKLLTSIFSSCQFLILLMISGTSMAQNSPCFWSSQLVKCFPTTGIYLDNSRSLRLGTNNTTNYVELKSANGMATNYTLTYPSTLNGANSVLSNDGTGVFSWLLWDTANTASSLVERDASGNFSSGQHNIVAANNAKALVFNLGTGSEISISDFAGVSLDVRTPGGTSFFQLTDDQAATQATRLIGRSNRDLTLTTDGTSASRHVIVQGSSGQTADLLDIQDNTPTNYVTVGSTGSTSFIGNIIKMNNVTTSWPASQGAANTTLHNNGSGTLTWALATLTTDVTGTLPIANGGTGQTTANTAFNALAPSQTSNSGKYLTTDGTNTSWGALTAVTLQNAYNGGNTIATASSNDIAISGTETVALTNNKGMTIAPAAGTSTALAVTPRSGQIGLDVTAAGNGGIVMRALSAGGVGSGTLGLRNTGTGGIITAQAPDNGATYISIMVPSSLTTYPLTLPNAQGAASTTLSNNGSGILSWAAFATNPLTTTGDMIYSSSGTTQARLAIGTEGQVLRTTSGIPAWKFPSTTVTKSSTDYTITDTDGFMTVLVSTGASNRTITLPSIANNQDRTITIKKTDSGAGTVIITSPTASKLDGATSTYLTSQYASMTVTSDGTNWNVVDTVGDYRSTATGSGNSGTLSNSSVYSDLVDLSLPAGTWTVSAMGNISFSTTVGLTSVITGLSTSSGDANTVNTAFNRWAPLISTAPTDGNYYISTGIAKFTFTTATTVHMKARAAATSGTISFGTDSTMEATRVR